jgi:lipoprotein signal peptidase
VAEAPAKDRAGERLSNSVRTEQLRIVQIIIIIIIIILFHCQVNDTDFVPTLTVCFGSIG